MGIVGVCHFLYVGCHKPAIGTCDRCEKQGCGDHLKFHKPTSTYLCAECESAVDGEIAVLLSQSYQSRHE